MRPEYANLTPEDPEMKLNIIAILVAAAGVLASSQARSDELPRMKLVRGTTTHHVQVTAHEYDPRLFEQEVIPAVYNDGEAGAEITWTAYCDGDRSHACGGGGCGSGCGCHYCDCVCHG